MKYPVEEKQRILKAWHKFRDDGLDAKAAAKKVGHTGAQLYFWEKTLRDAEPPIPVVDELQETLPEMPPASTEVLPQLKRKKRTTLLEIPVDDGEDRVQVVMVNGSSRHVESVMQTIASIFRR